jgi:hypothetical protein
VGRKGKGIMSMGKHDREKDEDGQVPADKPLPKGDWRDDGGGKHSVGEQDDDKQDDEK